MSGVIEVRCVYLLGLAVVLPVVLVDVNVLFSSYAAGTIAFLFTDLNVRAASLVPSSAFDRYSLVRLDLSGLRSLVVLVA